jgi:hypothetical protein
MRPVPNLILLCLAAAVFCGCHESGKWEDDARNWKRAMGYAKPKDIEVVHSLYWRSPHFTREDGWTFQIKAPASFSKEWLAHYKVKHPDADKLATLEQLKRERPTWFLPKPIAEYEIWVLADDQPEPRGNFWMFIDRSTEEFFVTDSG